MQINSLMPSSRWDYVPVIGSGMAAVQLFGRCLSMGSSEVGRHRYGVLAPGGIARAICLLLPVIGNIVIFVYDLVRERAFNRVSADGLALRDLWEGFQDDEEIVKAAVMQNEEALAFASSEIQESLRQEITEAISTVRANGLALENLDGWLKDVRSVVTAAVGQNELALQHASPSLQAILQQEITEAISTVRANGLALENFDGWLKNVRSVVTAAIEQNELALQYASSSLQVGLRAEITQKIAVVRANGLALENLEGWLKNVRSVVIAAIEQNGRALQYASPSLQERLQVEINQKIERVRANGLALEHLDGWLRNVRSVVIAAVKREGRALQYASYVLKNDRDVVLAAVRQNGLALKYANDALKNDRDVVLAAVRQNGLALEFASDELKNNRAIVLEAVMKNEGALTYASEELQAMLRQEITEAISAVRANGIALEDLDDGWLKDVRSVVIAAVMQDGSALQYASDALKGDEEVVRAAITHRPDALQYASDRLQNDRDFLLRMIDEDSNIIEVLPEQHRAFFKEPLQVVEDNPLKLRMLHGYKHMKHIVKAAVSRDGEALFYADEQLKKNKEIVLSAVQQNGMALFYADESLKDNIDVVRAAIANKPAALQYASARVRGVIVGS